MSSSSQSTTANNASSSTGAATAAASADATNATTLSSFLRSKRFQALSRMAGGVAFLSLPVGYWWYHARQERGKIDEQVRTKIRIPGVDNNMDEIMIEKHCQAGDVLVFDRRCETCATSPWAALACAASQQALCRPDQTKGGSFNHVGLIVPGHVRSKHDECDPTNLLLLEATPSEGIVARPLLSRLEHSQARSVWLLQLACPGEKRQTVDNNSSYSSLQQQQGEEQSQQEQQRPIVRQARRHVERELVKFRDKWTALSAQQGYASAHSTLTLGGALAYQLGILPTYSNVYKGPVSPSAWFVLMGLQQAAAAQAIKDTERQVVRVQDFVNNSLRRSGSSAAIYNTEEGEDVMRLRPGWRFLKPIPLRENQTPT